MIPEYAFKQGDRVKFDDGSRKGLGVIVGCATIEYPIMGRMYIVRAIDGSLPTVAYPFNTTTVAEIHLRKKSVAQKSMV